MSDHPHAKILQRFYEEPPVDGRWAWEDHVDESFVCHHPGDSLVSGDFVGAEAMRAHVDDFFRLSDNNMAMEVHAYYADDNWGVVSETITVSRKGETLTTSGLGLYRFSGPGRIAEQWEIPGDQPAWDRLWSD